MKEILLLAALVTLLSAGAAFAETGYAEVGLDEKLGSAVPLDLIFINENGVKVTLKDLVDRPTVLTLVYYSCSHICPQFLGGLAGALGGLRLDPADFRVLTVSFDDRDRPVESREMKRNYLKATGRTFPQDTWQFLTGDRENIMRLSDAVGLRFMKAEEGFIHPEVLIFLSPQGKITRYLQAPKYNYGAASPMTFSAFDLKMSFADSSSGKISTSGAGATPLFCFLHEPAYQGRFFSILKVSGALTVLALFLLFVYLRSGGKTSR